MGKAKASAVLGQHLGGEMLRGYWRRMILKMDLMHPRRPCQTFTRTGYHEIYGVAMYLDIKKFTYFGTFFKLKRTGGQPVL